MRDLLKCLIIEDDAIMVFIIKTELQSYGFDVKITHVENGEQMSKKLNEQKFDVIISDHNLPAFSSIEALDIRNKLCKDTPFLIYTNHIPDNIGASAMNNGCDMILSKEDVSLLPGVIEQLIYKTIKDGGI